MPLTPISRSPTRVPTALLATAGLVFVAACTDSDFPGHTELLEPEYASIPWCTAHPEQCGWVDPNPEAPGIWLGADITPASCYSPYGVGINDVDDDNVHDPCEQILATAFRPLLRYYNLDGFMGRESRWAVNFQQGAGFRVVYLLGYYLDGGALVNCHLPLCAPHFGDSEYIALDITYDYDSDHWILNAAHLSQHGNDVVHYTQFPYAYPWELEYPERDGGYPAVYVARQKHANYHSDQACDSGVEGFEDCIPNSAVRVTVGKYANIGSRDVQFVNCVSSANPSVNPGVECYWQVPWYRFSGWQDVYNNPYGGRDSEGYSDILARLGF